MSEVKVNKISPRTACGTVTLGDSGDTFTIPAGATITNSGTAAGFGATGAVSWDTTAKTTGFTAVSGVGYFVNTTAGIITVTLPASPSAGAVVGVSDYAGTADTNNITIGRNGSNINGAAADLTIAQENSAVTLVYVDGTQGWKATDTSSLSDLVLAPLYVEATGGTITCSGDYRIHTFTGPGALCVSSAGNPLGSNLVDYLVVAGGASGGQNYGGGGGAGGFRESSGTASGSYSASPLGACVSALPVAVTSYPITVGGGAAGPSPSPGPGNNGNNSVFAGTTTITSTGGGAGGGKAAPPSGVGGNSGGSGGGGAFAGASGGAGNSPPVSPPQGNGGGNPDGSSSSGGGATTSGDGANSATGGSGATTSISASSTTYGGGGGASGAPTQGGPGGGGGNNPSEPGSGTANTGGGGAGNTLGAGGSGIVIIRYKFQN